MFPPITPYATHMLPVTDGHTLYVEESGNPHGLPVLRLHGGPGSASKPEHRQYFNPQHTRIILCDQRGCGLSTATNPLKANTTQHLIADIEAIRTHLRIPQWHAVVGSSWGSTLALVYAQTHPKKVKHLILSAIFLADKPALDWFTHPHGAARMFPQAYQRIMQLLPQATGATLYQHLFQALTGPNHRHAHHVAQAFGMFDALTMELAPNHAQLTADLATNPAQLAEKMSLFAHYARRKCFLTPNQIINNAANIKHIPTHIVHGNLDLCCTPDNATRLHQALPKSTLTIIPLCGHRATAEMKQTIVSIANQLIK